MTAPDPGLTDLIAAHRLKQSYWNWWGCTGCDWRAKGTYGGEPTTETATEHAKHVVEQHTNGRIAELEAENRTLTFSVEDETRDCEGWKIRAEKAEATIARVENSLPEAPSTGFNPTLSEYDRGYERGQQVAVQYVQSAIKGDDIRAALEGEQQ